MLVDSYMGVNLDPSSNGAGDLQSMSTESVNLKGVTYTVLTLAETLMNHTSIVENLAAQIKRSENLAYLGLPFTLGETNSIAGQGRNGETNVFGDALWMVDFSLWAAAHVRKSWYTNCAER